MVEMFKTKADSLKSKHKQKEENLRAALGELAEERDALEAEKLEAFSKSQQLKEDIQSCSSRIM